jgi:hypothetical protein
MDYFGRGAPTSKRVKTAIPARNPFASRAAPVGRGPNWANRRINLNPVNRVVARRAVARRNVRPGFTRTVGYYGRMQPGGPELKFFDTKLASVAMKNTPALITGANIADGQLCLSLVPQDVTQSGRIGRKCYVKSIQFHYYAALPSGATIADDFLHVWIVQDMQCNGVQASYSDVFDTGSNAAVIGMHCRNLANSDRFKVLNHTIIDFQKPFDAATIEQKTGFVKCAIPLEFSGASGAITELKSNSIFAIYAASNINVTTNVTLTAGWRIKFSDL